MLRTSVGSQVYNRHQLNSYIQSITKVAVKMVGYFYHSRNYLIHPSMFYLYKNHIRPKIEYCYSIDIFMASVQPSYILQFHLYNWDPPYYIHKFKSSSFFLISNDKKGVLIGQLLHKNHYFVGHNPERLLPWSLQS